MAVLKNHNNIAPLGKDRLQRNIFYKQATNKLLRNLWFLKLFRKDTNQGMGIQKKRLPIGSLFRIIKIKKLYVLVQHHWHHQHKNVFAFVLLGWNDHSRFVWCRHIEPDLFSI
jgi:hypothetical protein